MAQREKGGRVVFIGNIPYGVSEEQICEIFGRVGSVVSFRLVHDKETGKPKGFGFLEYKDVDAAASAVRNLNGFQLQGRELKVDYSNDNSGKSNNQSDQQGSGRAPPPAYFNANMSAAPQPQPQANLMPPQGGNFVPPLPPGTDLPPGLTAPDAISRTLSAMPADQLLDVLSQMKNLAAQDPTKATQLLQQAPQLSYAIFQALILLGLVDTSVLSSLLQQQQQQAQPPPPQAPPQPQQQPPVPSYPPYGQQPPPQQYAPQPQYPAYGQPQQHSGYAPTPPQPQPQWQPPPQQTYQQPPPPQAQPQQQGQVDQQAMIQQVLGMTREQIFALDELPRNQLIQLRASLGYPV